MCEITLSPKYKIKTLDHVNT